MRLPWSINLLDVFSAGTETSSAVVEWAMSEMVKNPKMMKKAQAEVRRVYNSKGHVDETDLDQLTYFRNNEATPSCTNVAT